MDGGQHLVGVIEVVVDVQGEHDVHRGFGQLGIGVGAFDEGHVFQLLVGRPLFGGGQEIVENIFRDHAAAGSDAAAEEGQHVADSGADVGHGHAGLKAHGANQLARFLLFVARRVGQSAGHALALLLGLISRVGLAGYLRGKRAGAAAILQTSRRFS